MGIARRLLGEVRADNGPLAVRVQSGSLGRGVIDTVSSPPGACPVH